MGYAFVITCHRGYPTENRPKISLLSGSIFCSEGFLLMCFSPKNATVNTIRCSSILETFRRAIQNKRHGILNAGAVLIHDNGHLHTMNDTKIYCRSFSSSDFHLLKHLKKFMSGYHFPIDQRSATCVTRAACGSSGVKLLSSSVRKR